MYRLRLARARSFAYSRETRCYHVCPNNSLHTFDSSMFPARRSIVGEKRLLGLCDISRSPSRPRPTVLLNPKVLPPYPYPTHFPSSLFSFSPVPGPRRSRSRLSSRRILHPTDHSYESYLVASSTSHGSYEIAEASVVDVSEY